MRILVQCVLLFIVGLVWLHAPWISQGLTPWSQAIVNGIVGHVYPTTGQRATTVVLFREANLAQLEDPYPVPYGRHADVLEALSAYRPAAVFVDFAFIDQRSEADVARLGDAICALNANGSVPVFLAAPPRERDASANVEQGHSLGRTGGINEKLLRCAKPALAAMEAASGGSGVLTYKACQKPDCQEPARVLSPAFAMYEVKVRSPASSGRHGVESMEIIWANGFSELNRKWMNCKTPDPVRDVYLKVKDNLTLKDNPLQAHPLQTLGSVRELYRELKGDELAAKRKCPYTDSISVVHLLGPINEEVEMAIKGKAVFYGASFQMAGDRVVSPVYDDLPGVYLHAMAYDNLVTFGRDYKRADLDAAPQVANIILLVFTVLLLLVVDRPLAPAKRLFAGLAGPGPTWQIKWVALGLAVVSLALTVAFRPARPALFLLPALVLGMLTFLHVAATHGDGPPRQESAPAPARFLTQCLLGIVILAGAAVLFLGVDGVAGFQSALLFVLLPGYFAYKVLVTRDWFFVGTSLLMVGAAIVCLLPPINLGPRNIVGYVAFFQLARHFIKLADGVAEMYLDLRVRNRDPEAWGMWAWLVPISDRIFAFGRRGDNKEISDETAGHAALA